MAGFPGAWHSVERVYGSTQLGRFLGRIAVAVAAVASAAAACGGDDGGSGSEFGGGTGGTSSAGTSGAAGSGGLLQTDATGGTSAFDAAGGVSGFGMGGSGVGGSGGCDLANCKPPAPATPCCIVDLCGGDWGQGCQPFFSGTGGGAPVAHFCNEPPPPGAQLAAPPPTYGGTCPTIVDGKKGAMNTLVSSGVQRQFMVALPEGLQATEKLPVVFLWHWLGGDAVNFFNKANAGVATNQQRFIAVFPEDKGDLPLKWPYEITASPARLDEELRFFDDMYACVAQQFNVQKECIATGGMSAGGLFTGQLAGMRSQYVASFVALSGGTGGVVRPWANPPHKSPGVVVWGGPGDLCGLSFEQTSRDLQGALSAGGHFQIECIHNCNHSEPPFETPMGQTKFAAIWNFVFDHPYWLGAGQSPYNGKTLPAGWPSWCAIGAGASTPRTAPCQVPTQCI